MIADENKIAKLIGFTNSHFRPSMIFEMLAKSEFFADVRAFNAYLFRTFKVLHSTRVRFQALTG